MTQAFQLFVAVFAAVLAIGFFMVLTPMGKRSLLAAMRPIGASTGLDPWRLTPGEQSDPRVEALPVAQRARLAEVHIARAEKQALEAGRLVLWILTGGFVATVLVAAVIATVLPAFVMNGAWTYATYQRISLLIIYATAGSGLLVGALLVAGLVRRTRAVTCDDAYAAAVSLVALVRHSGVTSELAHELGSNALPKLRQLLSSVR